MSSSLIGRRLGKYEITELIGQGGMATVYKGYQPDIDRFVAIKVLPPHPGHDPNFGDRFRLEARTIAQLQHPHILPMHDYGTDGDILYLVTPYLDGGSLKDLIDESGPMPLDQAESILRQIASALDYAHRRGVIHRDVKPDNVLLDSEGNAMLADFGIVKILEGDTGLTATGGVLGTPAYMAPEQSQGEAITAQADIYSLGVIVYEMITGQQPYQADTPMQVMLKHITEPVPRISEASESLPPAVEPVIMRVLAKDPKERYESAAEFAQQFLRAVNDNTQDYLPTATASSTREAVANPTGKRTEIASDNFQTVVDAAPTPSQPLSPAVVPTQTIVTTQGGSMNTAVIVGGMAIIALLAVIVVLLVVNNTQRPEADNPPAATLVPATGAPTLPPAT